MPKENHPQPIIRKETEIVIFWVDVHFPTNFLSRKTPDISGLLQYTQIYIILQNFSQILILSCCVYDDEKCEKESIVKGQ
jgi:hypothetical protein